MNRYIQEIAGEEFTAKDCRTWAGTVLAVRDLYAAGPGARERESKKAIVQAVKSVPGHLGNRPAPCRKYYIHPAIPEAYVDGSLSSAMEQGRQQAVDYEGRGLRAEEYCVMVTVAAYQEKLAKASRRKAGARRGLISRAPKVSRAALCFRIPPASWCIERAFCRAASA